MTLPPDDELRAAIREALSNHENLCEDQDNPCGDCQRLQEALTELVQAAATQRAIEELNKVLVNSSGGGSWRRVIELRIAALQSKLTEYRKGE